MKIEPESTYSCDRCGTPLVLPALVLATVSSASWTESELLSECELFWPKKELHWCQDCWTAVSEPVSGWVDKQLNK